MTRLGWTILGVFVLLAAAFLSVTRFGGPDRVLPTRVAQRVPADVALAPGLLAVPVAGVTRSAIADSWGDARGGGRQHRGLDIMAPGGTPVLAAAPGRVEKLFTSRLGGTTVYIRSRDGRWVYYYAHLAGYAPGLAEGQAVRAGQVIAAVGDTGDAGAGNFHLHFSVTRMAPGQRWWQGEDINPYPLLVGGASRR